MDRQCSSCGGFCKKSGCERENIKPKTEKQKREWIGLTDDERHEIREWQRIQEELGPVWSPMMMYLYLAIEAKLKEKNT